MIFLIIRGGLDVTLVLPDKFFFYPYSDMVLMVFDYNVGSRYYLLEHGMFLFMKKLDIFSFAFLMPYANGVYE